MTKCRNTGKRYTRNTQVEKKDTEGGGIAKEEDDVKE